ncbi:hypothetical protein AVEN_257692-1 [Araneus ventricosus]|uniref:Uncharacterized protein n=1 Tax=Araneus ventricosus TaxID=182803 RepID=A0A4Y2LER3_ARAVE|nr:hypothetical protein AVEN_257692-1 [Araneus ventricosus]
MEMDDNAAADPADIPINIVPNHSNDPDVIDPLEEYYPTKEYARTALKRERYAKRTNGDELFHPDNPRYATFTVEINGQEHIVEYVPVREDKSPILMHDDKNNFIYPFDLTANEPIFQVDSDRNEIYFKEGEKEMCPYTKEGIPIYAKLNTRDEYVPTEQDIPYYAEDIYGNQHYPKTAEEHEYYIWIGSIYAKNAEKKEIYPKVKDGNDKPTFTNTGVQYAKDDDGNEYYPEMADGSEKMHGRFAYEIGNVLKYPLNKNKLPEYPKDPATEDEVYYIDPKTSLLVIGRDGNGDQVYANRKNGDQYYPGFGIYAVTKEDLPLYAFSGKGEIIFRKTVEGNEYYLVDETDDGIFLHGQKLLPRYAKDINNNEIYPILTITSDLGTYSSTEVTIGGKYAVWNNKPYYPMDAYDNEYIIHKKDSNKNLDEKVSFPNSYPITNDKFVIVPNVNNNPYILTNGVSHLTNKNIIGKLYRDTLQYHDFITDVIALRNSRGSKNVQMFTCRINNTGNKKQTIPSG